jgi:hypothetical protein
MEQGQAQAMAAEILRCEGVDADADLQSDLARLSEHLQALLPDLSDQWAVVQGEDRYGRPMTPAILALDGGVAWQVGVERPAGHERCWRRITVAVFQPDEFGLLIEREALTAPSPDRPQRLWRALARVKLSHQTLTLEPN